MTANTTTSTRRVAAGAVAQHDCADRGCLAEMLGLTLGDATASNAEEGFSSSGARAPGGTTAESAGGRARRLQARRSHTTA